MAGEFFERLKSYYRSVGRVLRGEAEAAAIFPNTSDKGVQREETYALFLQRHAPSKCNVFLGGFLFDESGVESKQLDIIITTDTSPRFRLHPQSDKGFSPVEGTLGIVSVKSVLDKAQLDDALANIASTPPTKPLGMRAHPQLPIKDYEDWPLKVLFAYGGLQPKTVLAHVLEFYRTHPGIPQSRQVNLIHVAGSCLIVRGKQGMVVDGAAVTVGNFYLFEHEPDVQGIAWVVADLQEKASKSAHILFTYNELIDRLFAK